MRETSFFYYYSSLLSVGHAEICKSASDHFCLFLSAFCEEPLVLLSLMSSELCQETTVESVMGSLCFSKNENNRERERAQR